MRSIWIVMVCALCSASVVEAFPGYIFEQDDIEITSTSYGYAVADWWYDEIWDHADDDDLDTDTTDGPTVSSGINLLATIGTGPTMVADAAISAAGGLDLNPDAQTLAQLAGGIVHTLSSNAKNNISNGNGTASTYNDGQCSWILTAVDSPSFDPLVTFRLSYSHIGDGVGAMTFDATGGGGLSVSGSLGNGASATSNEYPEGTYFEPTYIGGTASLEVEFGAVMAANDTVSVTVAFEATTGTGADSPDDYDMKGFISSLDTSFTVTAAP